MRIACLAWGSLVWDPGDMNLYSMWLEDGPNVPVEFARQSGGNRLTLVLGESFQEVPSLWAWMGDNDLRIAIETLRQRETTSKKWIGFWQMGDVAPELIPSLPVWAKGKRADAIIWTALPPKFNGEEGRIPSVNEALQYLRSLSNEYKQGAEEYVRRAPSQIRTPYRTEFENHLGWFPG